MMDAALVDSAASTPPMDALKKGRHRHAPDQLVALNELWDRTDHPSLEDRTSLGQRIGMPTKTVNAWFQNKRAAIKKKAERSADSSLREPSSAPASASASVWPSLPPISSFLSSASRATTPTHSFFPYRDEDGDEDADGYSTSDDGHYRALPQIHLGSPRQDSPAPSAASFEDEKVDGEFAPVRKARMRLSDHQTAELRQQYESNPHPSKEDRERLAATLDIGITTVTNWFQNQRSLTKKRNEDRSDVPSRDFAAFPPSTGHPSLSLLPPRSMHPSLGLEPASGASPKHRSIRASRSFSPYASASVSASADRPRRSRPEPHQLDGLRALYARTTSPSIEQRALLAREIGMDLVKVTNWFRNLRQTAKRRRLGITRSSSGRLLVEDAEEADGEMDGEDDGSMSLGPDFFSRDATPALERSAPRGFKRDLDADLLDVDADVAGVPRDGRPSATLRASDAHEDGQTTTTTTTDDEGQEAVTPMGSPPPPHFFARRRMIPPPHHHHPSGSDDGEDERFDFGLEAGKPFSPEDAACAVSAHLARIKAVEEEWQKTVDAAEVSGVPVQDAILLMTFHSRDGRY